jgi:hypothetical protein
VRWLSAVFVASSILPLSGCGGAGPTEPSRSCRRYATGVIVNSAPGTCSLDATMYRCNIGGSLREWSYRNLSDFILESNTPNRVLAAGRQTSGGTLLGSTYSWTTTYTYDARGRLSGRGRQRSNAFGSWLVDTITYTGWDPFNRPIVGELSVPDVDPTVPMPTLNTMPLSITYDDAARVMQTSNGEFVQRDQDGNIVKEVEFSDDPETDYVVTGSATACQ